MDNSMSKFFSKVYLWMFIGLFLSGGVAYISSTTPVVMQILMKHMFLFIALELITVLVLSLARNKLSPLAAKLLFILYSIISGATLSSIFLVYKIDSILLVFVSSSLLFGLMALYGYITKNDLSTFGKVLLFGLFAIIIMGIFNIFIGNSMFDLFISVVSVIIFLGLTAYDMQKLKAIYSYYGPNEEELSKASIYGALDLYLDFVNMFLKLLHLFGKEKD